MSFSLTSLLTESPKPSPKPKRRQNIPVLSGSAYLGQLYDAKRDLIMTDKFLWYPDQMTTKKADIENVVFESKLEETQVDRMNSMEIDASLAMSFLGGLIEVSTHSFVPFSTTDPQTALP